MDTCESLVGRLGPRSRWPIAILLTLALGTNGCRSAEEEFSFPEAESENIDGRRLSEAYATVSRISNLKSLLVWRNGRMVAERYFHGSDADDLHDVRSVTKSVLSALVGIAIEREFISGTGDTLSNYLTRVVDELDAAKGRITLHHLLTMTAGHEWKELGGPSEFIEWVSSPDQIVYVLQKPLLHPPGRRFCYSDGSAHLVSVVLTEATGMSAREFARRELFEPLGLGSRPWLADKRGYNYGGVGLRLTPRDMVRLGVLYLSRGSFNGEQIVPASWVDVSTRAQVPTGEAVPHGPEYGYLWWVGREGTHDFYFANGYGGQFIVNVPDLNLVVVATSEWRNLGAQAGRQWMKILGIILGEVLPSVQPTVALSGR